MGRKSWCLVLAGLLTALPALPQRAPPRPRLDPATWDAFQEALDLLYLELFDQASDFEFSSTQIKPMREYLDTLEDACTDGMKDRAKKLRKELDRARNELRRRMEKLNEAERHELHCTVQNRHIEQEQAALFAKHSVPLAYDHKKAKLDLLEHWPAELRRIQADLASGAYRQRERADVEDIGFREIVEGQAKDVKRGQEAEADRMLNNIR
jgi:hypothetical protein